MMKSIRKLLKQINEFSKVAGIPPIYKNWLYFCIVATDNWKLKKIPLTIDQEIGST